ncbi:MAG: hypothetical protein HYV09_36005 [Deltaproteobacteria bacterium]|nr:hypothetical protein [Deltaproteobacteria bacterium]
MDSASFSSRSRALATGLPAIVAIGSIAAALHACSAKDDAVAGEPDAAVQDADAPPSAPACITSPSPAPHPSGACDAPRPEVDAFDEALSKVGLDRCSFGLDVKLVPQSGWDLRDPRRLPDYEPLLLRPLRLPGYGRETAKWLDEAVASKHPVSRAIAVASVRRGAPIAACPEGAWFVVDEADAAPLATAIVEASAEHGGVDEAAVRAAIAEVPIDLQRALSPVVRALGRAAAETVAARGAVDPTILRKLETLPSWLIGSRTIKLDDPFLAALDGVDVLRLSTAAVHLATAIELADLERFAGRELSAVEIDTPFGAIVLGGAKNDVYRPGSKAETAALLLDLGGDDDYRVPTAAANVARPVSVAIDLAGKDRYGYVEKPTADDSVGTRLPSDGAGRNGGRTSSRVGRQGSAVLGVALGYDFGAGDDLYRSLSVSQGVGVLGVGVLFDAGGKDRYESETLSQGAGAFGIGMVLDRGGDDQYRGYNELQGFGFTRGVGAVVDLAGNDVYFANPGDPALGGDPIYPSAQLPGKGNTTMGQGCGYGRRWDTVPEEIGFLGGLGLLRDAAGNDTYTASVFAQGCGFLGFGALLEGGGDDSYDGLWYVQGATAHMGIALFHEAGGNDRYNATFPVVATSVGVGHDFSSTVHLDEGGDDVYRGPGLSLGTGYANGLGVLVNVGGTDSFAASGAFTLGGAMAGEVFKSPRGKLPTYGVFVKAGGSATYAIGGVDALRSGGTWSYAPENASSAGDAGTTDATFVEGPAKSVGVDRPSGKASLP